MITSGGNMQLAAGSINNYASQVIAGDTVAGDSINGTAINNTGPLGRQRVVSSGSASYTYVKSHAFSADDRRYDDVPDAPNSVNKLLSDPSFAAAIQKGLNKYLGGSK